MSNDQFVIMSNFLPNDNILNKIKHKPFAADKLNVDKILNVKMIKYVPFWWEEYFGKFNLSGWLKVGVVVIRLKKNKDPIFVTLRIDGVLNDSSNSSGNNLNTMRKQHFVTRCFGYCRFQEFEALFPALVCILILLYTLHKIKPSSQKKKCFKLLKRATAEISSK